MGGGFDDQLARVPVNILTVKAAEFLLCNLDRLVPVRLAAYIQLTENARRRRKWSSGDEWAESERERAREFYAE